MSSGEGWGGIADVAIHLSGTKDSIYRWVDSNDLPAHGAGRFLRFRLSEVPGWIGTRGGSDSSIPEN